MAQWSRRLGRLRATALGTAVALAAALGVGITAGSPADAAANCPDAVVIGARGSGEVPKTDQGQAWGSDDYSGLGPTLSYSYSLLRARAAVKGLTVEPVGVNYVAYPTSKIIDPSFQFSYTGSLISGSEATVKAIRDVLARRCSVSPQIVVMGYSQGAYVATDALSRLTSQERARVTAVSFIGDPLYDSSLGYGKGPAVRARGLVPVLRDADGKSWLSSTKRLSDLARYIKLIPAQDHLPTDIRSRAADYCAAGDFLCNLNPKTLALCGSLLVGTDYGGCAHTQYIGSNIPSAMANDVLGKLKKVQVDRLPGSDGSGTSGPLTVTTTALPDVYAHQPYDFQMTASDGTPPYTWAIDTPLPPGLTLSSSGRITGTPTSTYGQRTYIYVRDASRASAGGTFGFNQDGPVMDSLCRSLGLGTEAWLPGQTSATDLSGRKVVDPGAAYTWACSQGGPVLTQQQISTDCARYGAGLQAITSDADNAYSWLCRKG